MDDKTIMVPTIHINGTSRADLLAGIVNAMDALHAAEIALAGAYPNGRDYYPQGPGAITEATAQHVARQRAINRVRADLAEIAEAIA